MKTTSKIMLLFLLLMERTPHKSGVIDRNRKPQVLKGMSQEAALSNYSETLFFKIDMHQMTINNKIIKVFIDDQSSTEMLIKPKNSNNGKNLKSAKSPKTRDPSIHPELVSGIGRSGAWEGLSCKAKVPENSPGGSHHLQKKMLTDVQNQEDMLISNKKHKQSVHLQKMPPHTLLVIPADVRPWGWEVSFETKDHLRGALPSN